ncbi:AEC family transporter [Martelella endophytica]|uniref:Transporter n=1 Tax=Martelella endophytica TaxID=1486262 RepID=A0A0D5LV55_MAREN|nr:AEC family transporter [Martelella endophytica]AJY47263.1 transporter [Martelella endophytica]
MLIIFESVLPIFLTVALGVALKRLPIFDAGFWAGLNQLGYYVLFPALLFTTLSRSDFSSLATGDIGVVAFGGVAVLTAIVLALWPLLKRAGLNKPAYTSVFQTTTRWNGFMALAIADKLAGAQGMAVVALIMTVNIVPLNVINVFVLVSFSEERSDLGMMIRKILTNPLIIAALAGIFFNLLSLPVYEPVFVAFDLIARSALGMGLVLVGAGLVLTDALKPKPVVLLPSVLKLIVFPVTVFTLARFLGITGTPLAMLVLSAGVPTAMNGYVLARQLGGDARLYSAVVTVQTILSFFTLPAVLLLAGGQ